ncbi:CpaD family pilus assembly lipoprotein [Paludibacterium purpuratum]|uniref:Pilus biogenesis CpaD protein n=1 Tax=Paludibacterium purpuratum TaxID=1144873 RepID=A0A4R7B9I5_9NEIS|nr:CpaD family pilus assembly lipoprotein [Paludibacterium purpuratum]TDR80247.1 pilus biogenesis CpaD protein [Paludibacterium purpuratum]
MISSRLFFRLLTLAAPLMLTACAYDTSIVNQTAHMPDATVITVRDGQAIGPDCNKLEDEPYLNNGWLQAVHRPEVAFGCATYNNLARMIANPQDLVDPKRYPGPGATNSGAAVQRYYDDKVKAPTTGGSTTTAVSGGGQ